MGVPGWLLGIIKGFLEEKTLVVKYKGEKSETKEMPGGGPQGTILGLFLFLVMINDEGYPDEDREMGKRITQAINKRKEIETKHWKYVDDLTIAEAIDLKTKLVRDVEKTLEKPLTYHERTEHILPPENSKVQAQLEKIVEYTKENEMKLNKKKTKVMVFNTAKVRDFAPKLTVEGNTIEVVEHMKLLGVEITNDLRWNANTTYITKRGYNKLWVLRRLKKSGANEEELLDIYCKHIRSILEYAATVWHAALTNENTTDIERVQKSALAIIMGSNYISYENALKTLNMDKLSTRRKTLCLKLANKAFKSERFSSWFTPDQNAHNTRRKVKKAKNAQTRTQRFKKSSLPYMTQILNDS